MALNTVIAKKDPPACMQMMHPAVIAYWIPQHLPDAAGLASLVDNSWGTMATAQAIAEVPDALWALHARIVARDSEALGALFTEASGRLFALANAILRSREDAEEVVCDTFTQVWNDAHRFDPGRASVMGWLMVICRSRALDKRRQRRNLAQVVDIASAHELKDPQPLPVDLLSLLEQGTRVRQALADPAPNVRMKWLRKDELEGVQELLIRLAPGAVVPEHSHNKEEHMVILDGELHLGSHLLRQGDVHIAPPGSWHPPSPPSAAR